MCPDSYEVIFAVFIFSEQMCDTLTIPLPVDGHAPHINQRNDTERQSEEATMCNNNLVVLETFAIIKVSGLPLWMKNWLVEQKDPALLILTSTTLEHCNLAQ